MFADRGERLTEAIMRPQKAAGFFRTKTVVTNPRLGSAGVLCLAWKAVM